MPFEQIRASIAREQADQRKRQEADNERSRLERIAAEQAADARLAENMRNQSKIEACLRDSNISELLAEMATIIPNSEIKILHNPKYVHTPVPVTYPGLFNNNETKLYGAFALEWDIHYWDRSTGLLSGETGKSWKQLSTGFQWNGDLCIAAQNLKILTENVWRLHPQQIRQLLEKAYLNPYQRAYSTYYSQPLG